MTRPFADPDRIDLAAAGTHPGLQLWLVRGAAASERSTTSAALARSLAQRHPSLVLCTDDVAPRALGAAVAAAAGAPLEVCAELAADPARQVTLATRRALRPSLVIAADGAVLAQVFTTALGLGEADPSAVHFELGRASLLLGSKDGWLLVHHNVLDPGSLTTRAEGLGRPG